MVHCFDVNVPQYNSGQIVLSGLCTEAVIEWWGCVNKPVQQMLPMSGYLLYIELSTH